MNTTLPVSPHRRQFHFKRLLPYLFISPFFIMYAIFGFYPLMSGIKLALENNKGVFVGIENFRKVFSDAKYWLAIKNAFMYTCGSVFIILPVALIAALLLNSPRIGRMRGWTTTVYFFPNVTSVIVIGIVFKFLLKANDGPINAILQRIGLIDKPLRFLSDPNLAITSLVIVGSWRYFGVNSLYFLSGLQGIPHELREAARIDGANPVQEFFRIQLPLLKPIMTYIVFTAIVGSFSISGEVYTLVGVGGTGARNSMLFPVVYLYNTMFRDNMMNRASAMGYVLAVILLIITTIQRRLFKSDY